MQSVVRFKERPVPAFLVHSEGPAAPVPRVTDTVSGETRSQSVWGPFGH